MENKMRLLITGDFSLQGRLAKCEDADVCEHLLWGGVRYCKSADYSVVNFESPATHSSTFITKDGPTLKQTPKSLLALKRVGFNVVTLANNHLKDYGERGVLDTLQACRENGIQTVGAGENLTKARLPLILQKNHLTVGILNVCEHESSIASDIMAGAAPLDLTNLFYDIRELRKQVDKVIVIIHGGCENYQLPTPRMKRDYHLIVDFGADVIVNHHQHCYSGYEIYEGKPIFYGLGNFFFDNLKKRNDKWNEGLLLHLEVTKDKIDYELIPFRQCDVNPTIEMRNYEEVRTEVERLNAIIADDALLNECFDKLVTSKKPLYQFLPYGNHYLRALYSRGFLPDCMTKNRKAKIENAVSCETHREVLLRYFEQLNVIQNN